MPRYLVRPVEIGNEGMYGMVLKFAVKNGVVLLMDSTPDASVARGKTEMEVAPLESVVNLKSARCLGMFQSGIRQYIFKCSLISISEINLNSTHSSSHSNTSSPGSHKSSCTSDSSS